MNGENIKTLAEYIAKLHKDNAALENPEEYTNNENDTNGVGQDHVDEYSSRAND